MMNWVVIKFGGTSVATAENWRHIANIVRRHRSQGHRVLVVCSAITQVSNKLEALLTLALLGKQDEVLKDLEAVHQTLCRDLSVDFTVLEGWFKRLRELAEGVSLIQEASPRIRALVMAHGELLSTTLGAVFLRAQNLEVDWQDARELLLAENDPIQHHSARYLMAYCQSNPDPILIEKISGLSPVVITQGFIARNSANETVLLGRGGSDTSAAYFAAKIQSQFCEIWTDVKGIFTANPKQIPQAHLLSELDYDEAQEIASMGGKVLHPNCIPPLKHQQIPLFVKCTFLPEHPGTKISVTDQKTAVKIKSVICKYGISLISIETVRMLHQVGFLANVFNCFKQRGLSIDLISTSESSVTVSLDNVSTAGDVHLIQLLLQDLSAYGHAHLTGPCGSISLVGHYIRSSLPKLGEVFELFSQHQIYLMSQAANDLNLTFVVEEDQAERLAQKIHALLIEPAYRTEELKTTPLKEMWWQKSQGRLLSLMEEYQQPLYVYDQATLQQQAQQLLSCHSIDAIYYSVKANRHPDILKLFFASGLNFECVSIYEVQFLLHLFPGIDKSRILFTPNFALKTEYQQAFDEKILVTVDNLYPLKNWPEVFAGQSIILRIDPGEGYGHHRYVCTGGTDSKFGISLNDLAILLELLSQHAFKVVGLHAHVGSGILREQMWKENFLALSGLMRYFPDVQILNLGGGLGVPENSGQKSLDLQAVDASLSSTKAAFPNIKIWLEPGRFLVAEAGVLLARVTQVKQKSDVVFIGVETGMNSLIRPALYGSYHEIVNLSRLDQPPAISAHITGPICESGDILGYSRILPETREGDVILIANTGAYGRVMSSSYNMREPAREYFLRSNT
jgi:bifunctional diaminopimelate decarboxylase / aspartate kinase